MDAPPGAIVVAPFRNRSLSALRTANGWVLVGFVPIFLTPREWRPATVTLSVVLLAAGVVRSSRIRFVVAPDGVVITNFWRTVRLRWSDVERIATGTFWCQFPPQRYGSPTVLTFKPRDRASSIWVQATNGGLGTQRKTVLETLAEKAAENGIAFDVRAVDAKLPPTKDRIFPEPPPETSPADKTSPRYRLARTVSGVYLAGAAAAAAGIYLAVERADYPPVAAERWFEQLALASLIAATAAVGLAYARRNIGAWLALAIQCALLFGGTALVDRDPSGIRVDGAALASFAAIAACGAVAVWQAQAATESRRPDSNRGPLHYE